MNYQNGSEEIKEMENDTVQFYDTLDVYCNSSWVEEIASIRYVNTEKKIIFKQDGTYEVTNQYDLVSDSILVQPCTGSNYHHYGNRLGDDKGIWVYDDNRNSLKLYENYNYRDNDRIDYDEIFIKDNVLVLGTTKNSDQIRGEIYRRVK